VFKAEDVPGYENTQGNEGDSVKEQENPF